MPHRLRGVHRHPALELHQGAEGQAERGRRGLGLRRLRRSDSESHITIFRRHRMGSPSGRDQKQRPRRGAGSENPGDPRLGEGVQRHREPLHHHRGGSGNREIPVLLTRQIRRDAACARPLPHRHRHEHQAPQRPGSGLQGLSVRAATQPLALPPHRPRASLQAPSWCKPRTKPGCRTSDFSISATLPSFVLSANPSPTPRRISSAP